MVGAGHAGQRFHLPAARRVGIAAPFIWLKRGWLDLCAAPAASLAYGAIFAAMGWALRLLLGEAGMELALATGFFLLGPFLAVGLYDISRRLERGERPAFGAAFVAWRANGMAILLYALGLTVLFTAWVLVSSVAVAFIAKGGFPGAERLIGELAATPDGRLFLLFYAGAGALFALLVFATGVVSVPMLLDHPAVDTFTAVLASLAAVRDNLLPMLAWAGLIVACIGAGIAAGYAGLAVTLPLIGHASWHAYRALAGDMAE